MNKTEANALITRFAADPSCYAELVRILPESVDPVKTGDNGWDVKVTYHYNSTVYED